jgi:hypothetical protein
MAVMCRRLKLPPLIGTLVRGGGAAWCVGGGAWVQTPMWRSRPALSPSPLWLLLLSAPVKTRTPGWTTPTGPLEQIQTRPRTLRHSTYTRSDTATSNKSERRRREIRPPPPPPAAVPVPPTERRSGMRLTTPPPSSPDCGPDEAPRGGWWWLVVDWPAAFSALSAVSGLSALSALSLSALSALCRGSSPRRRSTRTLLLHVEEEAAAAEEEADPSDESEEGRLPTTLAELWTRYMSAASIPVPPPNTLTPAKKAQPPHHALTHHAPRRSSVGRAVCSACCVRARGEWPAGLV